MTFPVNYFVLETAVEPLELTGTPVLLIEVGDAYSFTPDVSGGTPPYSFTRISATPLPSGWTFSAVTGAIATASASAALTISDVIIRCTDATGTRADFGPFNIQVVDDIVVIPPPGPAADAWYVDLNAGSDAADGTTPATAWRNPPGALNGATGVAASTVLVPGAVVRYIGGGILRKTLQITASGTLANKITHEGWSLTPNSRPLMDAADPVLTIAPAADITDAGGAANWADLHVVTFDPAGSAPQCIRLFDDFGLLRIGRYPELADPIFEDDIGRGAPVGNYFTVPGVVPGSQTFTSAEAAAILAGQEGYARICLWRSPELIGRAVVAAVVGNDVTLGAFTAGSTNGIYSEGRMYILNSRHHCTQDGSFAVIAPGKAIVKLRGSSNIRIGRARHFVNFRANSNVVVRNFDCVAGTQVNRLFDFEVGRTTTSAPDCVIEDNYIHDCYAEREGSMIPAILGGMPGLKLRRNRIADMMQISVSRGLVYEATDNIITKMGGTGFLIQNDTPGGLIERNIISMNYGIHANGIALYSNTNNFMVGNNFLYDNIRPLTFQVSSSSTAPDKGRFNIITRNVMVSNRDDGAIINNSSGAPNDDMTITDNVAISLNKTGIALFTQHSRMTLGGNLANSISESIPGGSGLDNRASWIRTPNTIVPRTWIDAGTLTPDYCQMMGPNSETFTLDLTGVAVPGPNALL